MMKPIMPAGCWDLDLATGALNLCPHSRKMFGLSPHSSELIAESEWVARFHPDDLAVVRRALTECLVHQKPYAERFRTIHPDGSVQTVLGIGRPVENGKHGRFVGWNFDLAAATRLAGEWVSAHPESLLGEHLLSIVPRARRKAVGSAADAPSDDLLERAESILRIRRSRERLLGRAMLGEPAFDLLLCLYVRSGQQESSLTSLASAARIPYSSAMRWITYLVDKGLVTRCHSKSDRRATTVHLTQSGRAVLDEFLMVR